MTHGRGSYGKGCRCAECTKAQRDYMREWKRSKAAPAEIACKGCGVVFIRNGRRRWCSPECKTRREHLALRRRTQIEKAECGSASSSSWVWISGTCGECGEAFTRHGMASPFCSKACSTRSRRRERRALVRGLKVSRVRRFQIHERDDWTCHICGDPVNRGAVVPALDAPTLDHVVALAAGGPHTEDNLKTAHFYCNSVKRELPLSLVA